MRWALISGDGLPVSGLLTIFRNVVDRARVAGVLDTPVVADLGYSWRPDKHRFFPGGPPGAVYPDWLRISETVPVDLPADELARRFDGIRRAVAEPTALAPDERAALHGRIRELADPYETYFTEWLAQHDIDWAIAINMTLSDAVPVTAGLHRAAATHWAERRGGVLYWDHDLFGSCGIVENGHRLYPESPNEFTPVPGSTPSDRWAVVSPGLLAEASTYPTHLDPALLTNVLPLIPDGELEDRHLSFVRQRGIDPGRPLVLVPVRVFAVKGVEIAVRVLAGMCAEARRTGRPEPVMLVFGSLDEDPGYVRVVRDEIDRTGTHDAIVFLDGVPMTSFRDRAGRWHLDEIDLLRLARASGGAVLFTPNCTDVETVGLGPALAGLAGLPCAVTPYDAFDEHFGPDYARVRVDPADPRPAGAELVRWMAAARAGDAAALRLLAVNEQLMRRCFADSRWSAFITSMAEEIELAEAATWR